MAAVQVLRDNPEFNKKLGNPIKEASDIENAMQKVTGRIPVLSVKEQEQLYALLEQEYADTIAMAEAMGGTGLEAQALPLDAKLVSSIELTPKKDGVDAESAFTEASNLQEFDVKVLGKPYTAKKVHELVAQGVVGHEGLSDALHADAESFVEKRAAKMEDEERRGDFIARAEENLHAIDDALFRFEPGLLPAFREGNAFRAGSHGPHHPPRRIANKRNPTPLRADSPRIWAPSLDAIRWCCIGSARNRVLWPCAERTVSTMD